MCLLFLCVHILRQNSINPRYLFIMRKILFIVVFTSCTLLIQGQSTKSIIKVNKKELLNLSSNYKTILLYTFSIKCEPCILHLKNAIELSEKYKTDLYILLVEKKGKHNQFAIKYLEQRKKNIKIITIRDKYGRSNRKSYKKFLTEITPKKFKNINDFSKYIVIKNKEVIMVTNYTDNKISDDWKNDLPMLKAKVIPLLKQ